MFVRNRASGLWVPDTVIDPAELELWDQQISDAVDGAAGGAYAPSSPIEIGGAGVRVTGTLTSSGPLSSTGTLQATGNAALAGLVSQFSPQASNFPLRVADAGEGFTDVAFGLSSDIYIAVGSISTGPKVLTSPDGVTWTSRTSGESSELLAVAANSSVAILVTPSGNLRSSTDGTTWTSRTLAIGQNTCHWFSGASLFVVGGSSGRISTSPDGITYTARTTPSGFSAKTWKRFASKSSGGSLIVGIVSGSHDKCVTSTDGLTWTERSLAESIDAKGVCWSSGLQKWVIVGASGKVQHSSDGITWTAANVTSPVTFDAKDCAAHGHLVVVSHEVSSTRFRTYYTTDLVTWRMGAELDGLSSRSRLVYVPERNRFVAANGRMVHLSMVIGDGNP